MMRSRHLITLEVIFFAGFLASICQAGNWQEFALWPTTDEQEAPDIYGKTIVWQQFISEYGDYDIYVADINTPGISNPADPSIFVIGDSNDQTNPAVYENIVVWQDYVVWEGTADWDIRAADISDQIEPRIFVVSDIPYNNEQKPAIHGNTVVWQDGEAGDFDIYGADITDLGNPAEFGIANFELDQQTPAIYRTTVVWQDNFFGDWDIYAADISEPNNPVEFAIVTNESSQTNPDIDGNIVVWQDYRNNNWDIFGYNLTTQKEFQITDNSHDQTNPAISGNIVVWQDNRSGNSQIYAVVLDGPEVARCTSRITGDINGDCKVDFADFALMTSHWLECNLEPAEMCLP